MDNVRVGRAFRAVRLRRRWRQLDVAHRSGLHRSTISLIERGHWTRLSHAALRRVGEVLEIRVGVVVSWRGGDLDRLINADHSQLHEMVGRLFDGLPEWVRQHEVSFAVYSERGVIDILAFHPPTGALLVIELKTVITDVNDLLGTLDRKVRLARRIARERGWAGALSQRLGDRRRVALEPTTRGGPSIDVACPVPAGWPRRAPMAVRPGRGGSSAVLPDTGDWA